MTSASQFHMFAGAPAPVAPFSHACERDGWVFITGQLPIDPGNESDSLPDGIELQTRKTFDNLLIVLGGLGLELSDVVSARAFLTHFYDDYEQFNSIYASYFPPGQFPARTCIGVTGLARHARVEIDMIARRPATA
jgi:2-iminobutanoate/2-iminopropanoate deaminase